MAQRLVTTHIFQDGRNNDKFYFGEIAEGDSSLLGWRGGCSKHTKRVSEEEVTFVCLEGKREERHGSPKPTELKTEKAEEPKPPELSQES